MKRGLFFLLRLLVSILLILFEVTPAIFAQNYIANVQKYGIKEGLSHREIFAIHQDKEGFIWLGTKYGLNRFDGRTFKTWTKEKQGLSSNEIHHIFEDAEGWLWLFTGNNWFHTGNPIHCSLIHSYTGEVLTPEEKFGNALPFKISEILHIVSDANDNLLFSTSKKELYSYSSKEGFQLIPISLDNYFFPTYADLEKDVIWGYTGQKLELTAYDFIKINTSGQIIFREPLEKGTDFLRVLGENAGDLYFATFQPKRNPTLCGINEENGRFQLNYLSFSSEIMKDWEVGDWSRQFFYNPKNDLFWFKSYPHFFVFQADRGMIFDFEKEHGDFINSDIHTIFFDKDDFAWAGTADGLYKVELQSNPFRRLLYQNYEGYQIWDAYSCRGIWAENNQIWVNTYRGRRTFDAPYTNTTILPSILNPFTDTKRLYLLWNPLAIYKEKNHQTIWFGESSLVKRDINSGKEEAFFWKESIDHCPQIWNIYQDENEKIWIGSDSGIGYLDREDNILKRDEELLKEMEVGFVHAFVERSDGSLWVCTGTGLYLWAPNRGILNRFWSGGEGIFQLPHDNILHVREDAEGILWLASGGGGLIRLDYVAHTHKAKSPKPTTRNQEEKTFQQFTTEDGLTHNNLYAVYEDDFGNLWMSSDYGIVRFNKASYKAKAYLPADGITHHEFNRIAHFQDESGSIYFGSLNGLTIFDPKDFQEESILKMPVKITDFQQMDGERNMLINKTNELLKNRKITLKPNDGFCRLQFAMLDYRNPELVRFAWKTEGLDDNWNHINENFIRIIGLPYGKYTIKIKGQSATGEWSQNELHLPVVVLRPFYLKSWFLSICAIGALAVFIFLYKWRIRQLKNRASQLNKLVKDRTRTIEQQTEELRQLDKLKSRFFSNVSHELRTPLTLILGPLEDTLKKSNLDTRETTFLQLAHQNAKKLLKLVNSILDFSRIEAGKLKLEESPILLYSLMHRLVGYYESSAQFHEIELEYRFEAEPNLQILIDVQKFETIFNNLISNALKFTTKDGKIVIGIREWKEQLELTVKDTGRGIHPDDIPHIFDRFYQTKKADTKTEGGSGIGLALCQEYTNMLKGQLRVESELDKGSTFYLTFPKKITKLSPKAEIDNSSSLGIPKPKAIASDNLEGKFANSELPKILLVEDNPSLRTYIETVLKEHYQLITAQNGQVALDLLRADIDFQENEKEHKEQQQLPDLIISDIMMPVLDGFQLLEKIKEDARLRNIPFLMLTARAAVKDKLKALQIGVDDYLLKPFDTEEIIARIDNLLRNYEERQWAKGVGKELEDSTLEKNKVRPEWQLLLDQLLEEELDNTSFSIDHIPEKLGMSRRNFFRQMKEQTGLTPNQYLREVRLQKAREFLETAQYSTVKEICYAVGFIKVSYFSELYKKRFGKSPMELI